MKQGADGRVYYLHKLKNIHCDILTASAEGVCFSTFCVIIKKTESIFTYSPTLFTYKKLRKIKILSVLVQCPLQTYSL